MELDKEKLLFTIKEALADKDTNSLNKAGTKEQILNSLPSETKEKINGVLKDPESLKKLLNSKEAKDLIAKFLKDK